MTRSAVHPYEIHGAVIPGSETTPSAPAGQQLQLGPIRDRQRRALDALDRVCEDLRRQDDCTAINTTAPVNTPR